MEINYFHELFKLNSQPSVSNATRITSTNVFMIIESVAKHGDKNSAIELNINYICKLPLPRERIDLNIVVTV
jgi:hypothetical protein